MPEALVLLSPQAFFASNFIGGEKGI